MFDQSTFINELLERGFFPHSPSGTAGGCTLVHQSAGGRTISFRFSKVGIDFQVSYQGTLPDARAVAGQETSSGVSKRFRYDAFTAPNSIYDSARNVLEQTLIDECVDHNAGVNTETLSKNVSPWCTLCLFDLDGVLLDTTGLAAWRSEQYLETPDDIPGYRAIDSIEAELLAKYDQNPGRRLYKAAELTCIRNKAPGILLGIVTRAPRLYVQALLQHAYPHFSWDLVICQEDLQVPLSITDGLSLAMQCAKVCNPAQVLYIGDSSEHANAAFEVGCWAALERSSFPATLSDHHHRILESGWDGVLNGAHDLLGLINLPCKYLPELDAVSEWGFENVSPRRLRVSYQFRGNNRAKTTLPVVALGRYFSTSFHKRANWHPLSVAMLTFKRTAIFPRAWSTVLQTAITRIAEQRQRRLLITVMPAKPDTRPRLELLLAALASDLAGNVDCDFKTDVMEFSAGATSSHLERRSREQRLLHAERFLRVAQPHLVKDRDVVLLDDIVTSGASLVIARERLHAAGAVSVTCIALAQALSRRVS